jgi:16S rRNA (cytosine1402-N4)-methyltransferase
MSNYHTSVLLNETIKYLQVKPEGKYIDATLGGGGHTELILERGGRVLGLDVDQEALDYVEEKIKSQKSKVKNKEDLILTKGNFRNIDEIVRVNGFGPISGILFDLGVSGHQLETTERGFSFVHNAPLDMRMDRDLSVSAMDLLKVLTKGELYELFTKFGEERFAKRIASYIVESRRIKPVETTAELDVIVKKCVPYRDNKTNPSTRIFQALRIAVNDELGSLSEALPKAVNLLEQNGRIVVITFHSLEDRIVKHMFVDWERQGCGIIITRKPVLPSEAEIISNPKSRSAKMRVFERNSKSRI